MKKLMAPEGEPYEYKDLISANLVSSIRSWVLKMNNRSMPTNLDRFEERYNISFLMLASFLGQEDLVSTVLNKSIADIDKGYEAAFDAGPLHVAIIGEHFEVIQDLVEAGADINSTIYHLPPLIIATALNNTDIINYLLDAGANKDSIFGAQNLTALMLSIAIIKNSDIANSLIMRGADVNLVDAYGSTALHYAAFIGSEIIVQNLLNAGADLNAVNEAEASPLLTAFYQMETNISNSRMQEYEKIVDILIRQGADVNFVDSYRNNALHYAAYIGSAELVQNLVNFGANVNAKNTKEETPSYILLRALYKKPTDYIRLKEYEKVVDILISKGADVNTKDSDGWTPLHAASFQARVNIVKKLLRAQADPNVLGASVSTPLATSYAWG